MGEEVFNPKCCLDDIQTPLLGTHSLQRDTLLRRHAISVGNNITRVKKNRRIPVVAGIGDWEKRGVCLEWKGRYGFIE